MSDDATPNQAETAPKKKKGDDMVDVVIMVDGCFSSLGVHNKGRAKIPASDVEVMKKNGQIEVI